MSNIVLYCMISFLIGSLVAYFALDKEIKDNDKIIYKLSNENLKLRKQIYDLNHKDDNSNS